MKVLASVIAAVLISVASSTYADDNIKLEDVPEAARRTIERETAGGTISEIEREVDDGKTKFEVEYVEGGQKWEIEVAEDGKLLKKGRE